MLVKRLGMAAQPVADILRRAAPWSALVIVLAQLFSGAATAWALMLTARVLERVIGQAPTSEHLRAALPLVLMLCGVHVLRIGMDAATAVAKAKLAPKVHRVAEEQLFQVSLQVDLASFDDPDFYDQLHRAKDRGVVHMESATTCLIEVLSASFSVAGAALALVLLQPLLLPILVLALLPDGWAALKAASLQYAAMPTTISLTRQTQMFGELATHREAAPEIRATQAKDYVLAEYRRSAIDLEQHLVTHGLAEAKSITLGRILSGLGQLGMFVALGAMLYARWLDLAAAGTAVIAIRSASAALARLMLVSRELFEKGLYISDYRAFIEQSIQRRCRPVTSGQVAPAKPGYIELDHVGFHYQGTVQPALKNISLTILAGQTIALVGENGSGKTTLAKLLAGLYQPTSGRIAWDGVDLRDMTPDSLASRIAMVLQEPVRWPRSARDNIRLGRHEYNDADDRLLLQAARESGAMDVIERLPQQWDTLLSRQFHGGQDLSGGQWQRLAIARGLYRNAPLVIWDEPTSSLDAKAEHAVYESLRQLARQRTVILITHRLASIRNADCIYFLERGALVEQGTHSELVEANGRYAELYRLQAIMHS
ncbi:MAG: ABC transporter ATP-binding protein [Rhodanobacter sp.]